MKALRNVSNTKRNFPWTLRRFSQMYVLFRSCQGGANIVSKISKSLSRPDHLHWWFFRLFQASQYSKCSEWWPLSLGWGPELNFWRRAPQANFFLTSFVTFRSLSFKKFPPQPTPIKWCYFTQCHFSCIDSIAGVSEGNWTEDEKQLHTWAVKA